MQLFVRLAPNQLLFNNWFCRVIDEALCKEFKGLETNENWLLETRPILEASWHCKNFLEQMLRFGREPEESPQILPSGRAPVLHLYDLR
jgi:hypothetical protein